MVWFVTLPDVGVRVTEEANPEEAEVETSKLVGACTVILFAPKNLPFTINEEVAVAMGPAPAV
jgi:hypothetical protein